MSHDFRRRCLTNATVEILLESTIILRTLPSSGAETAPLPRPPLSYPTHPEYIEEPADFPYSAMEPTPVVAKRGQLQVFTQTIYEYPRRVSSECSGRLARGKNGLN